MSRKTIIEQHPLIDGQGNRVDFLIEDWGEINDFSYDHLKAHRHNFYEILVFEKGNANHDIDFSSFAAKSGNVHFVAPDNVHLLLREKNSQGFSIQFTNGQFSSELTDKLPFNSTQPTLKLSNIEFKKVIYLISQIRAELSNTQHLSETLIRSYFEAVLLLLVRNASQIFNNTRIKSQSLHIDNFKKLVNDSYKQHYAVEHYSGSGKSAQTDDSNVASYLDALKRELIFWGTNLARSATSIWRSLT